MKTITIEVPDNLSVPLPNRKMTCLERFFWPPPSSGTARD